LEVSMRSSSILALVVILAILSFIGPSITGSSESVTERNRIARNPVQPTQPHQMKLNKSATQPDTTILAEYTFDTGGAPDPQGWTTHDLTLQVDTFFHVAGVAELNGGNGGTLLPLEGVQSLWCGLTPSGQPPVCTYETLPGYGNNWRQCFELLPLPVEGDVTVSYRIQWDTEAGYDYAIVEYQSPCSGWIGWTRAPVNGGIGLYDGQGDLVEAFTIADSCLTDTLRLRFWFESDGMWSDEDGLYPTDGAVLVDSIIITDTAGVVDFQDFEGELPGALETLDGRWRATVSGTFGNYAALHAGSTVVQEDTLTTNSTHLWGFFDDVSNGHYTCGPEFPQQGIVPYGYYDDTSLNICLEINNEIRSPQIPIWGVGDDMVLSFRVYRDMPLDGNLFYVWHVRSWVAGCPEPWKDDGFPYFGSQKSWLDASFSIRDHIDPSASHIQVAIGVVDYCGIWCLFGCGDGESCHRHTPLIDDVTISRIDTSLTAVEISPHTNFLTVNYPNPFNPSTTIKFGTTIGGRVSLKIYDVGGRLVRILDDGFRSPGVFAVQWDGKTDTGTFASSGIYFYRLVAPGFSETKKMVLLK
jgi:hypothetical protein